MIQPNRLSSEVSTDAGESTVLMTVSAESTFTDRISTEFGNTDYQLVICNDRHDAMARAERRIPDIVLVDVGSLGTAGFDLCSQLRTNNRTKNVLIALASEECGEYMEVNGFVRGADDFFQRSCSKRVMSARFDAMLRRRSAPSDYPDHVSCCGIVVDRIRHRVTTDGQAVVDITPTEFALLNSLVSEPDRVFKRHELISATHSPGVVVLERTIDVHIRSLRIKLGEHAAPIQTVRGVGYRFCDNVPTYEESFRTSP